MQGFYPPIEAASRSWDGLAGGLEHPQFSLDDGTTYSSRPMVEAVVDGRTKLRPASPEDYTDIRWTVHGEVEPDTRVTAAFQVRYGPMERKRRSFNPQRRS